MKGKNDMTLAVRKVDRDGVPYPTPEEAVQSILKIRLGDMQERETFFRQCYPAAVFIASKFARLGMPYADALGACHVGLIYAVSSFDVNNGAPFINFAMRCMERRIINLRRDENCQKRSINNQTTSLNVIQTDAGYSGELMDMIQVIDEQLEVLETQEQVRDIIHEYFMRRYPAEELMIFQLYVEEELTQRELAKRFNSSQMTISRTLKRVQSRLKQIAEELEER